MPRVSLDMNKPEYRHKVKGQWRVASGLVPGESNEGLSVQILASPARLADYDDFGQLQHRFSVSRKFEPAAMVI